MIFERVEAWAAGTRLSRAKTATRQRAAAAATGAGVKGGSISNVHIESATIGNRALISSNVKKLAVITQALSAERDSLAQALQTAPLAVDNLINAYDAQHNTLDGRADLNELSIWPSGSSGQPLLLPNTATGGH